MGWSEIQREQPDMDKLKNPYPRDAVKQIFRVEKADSRMKLALILPWVLFVVGTAVGYWFLMQPLIKRFDVMLILDSLLILVSFFGGLFVGVYNLCLWQRVRGYYYGITEHEDLVCLIENDFKSAAGRDMDELRDTLNAAIAKGEKLDGFDMRIMKRPHIVRRRFLQVDIRYVDFGDGTFEYIPLYTANSGYESILSVLNDRPAPPVL